MIFLSLFLILFTTARADMVDFLQFAAPKNGEEEVLYQRLYQFFLADLVPEESPFIIALGGASGSGKSTWRKTHYSQMKNVYFHDIDDALLSLPGYHRDVEREGLKSAFEKWWPTAMETVNKLAQYAIQSRYSIIYDRTCGSPASYSDLMRAKTLGYRIVLYGFCIDTEVALARISLREEQEGRTVTPALFYEYRARFSALWPQYLSFVDEAFLYDNAGPAPRLIFSKEATLDPDRYQRFLAEKQF